MAASEARRTANENWLLLCGRSITVIVLVLLGRFTVKFSIVYLENAWNSKQMITKGEAAIPLETTPCAFSNQSQSKQRSDLVQELT